MRMKTAVALATIVGVLALTQFDKKLGLRQSVHAKLKANTVAFIDKESGHGPKFLGRDPLSNKAIFQEIDSSGKSVGKPFGLRIGEGSTDTVAIGGTTFFLTTMEPTGFDGKTTLILQGSSQ